MTATKTLILGAGPAGLATALGLGEGARVLEAADAVGGLCRSVEFGGGVFDLGGHSFHTPHPEVADLVESLMAGRWARQRRDARVWVGGRLIPYPFQSHVDRVGDPAMIADCRANPPDPAAAAMAATLEDWLIGRFGAGVARHFMLPYNRKLWARDLRRIDRDWVGERIVGGEGASAPGAAATRRPLGSDAEIAYPAEGGFGGIWDALARRCPPVSLGERVIRVDPAARVAVTAAGRVWPWRRLVSTLPLPALMRAVDGAPAGLIAESDRLEAVSLKIVMALIDGPVGAAPQRVYVASDETPAHKIAFNHTSSPSLRARPVHAVMAEVAYSADKPVAEDRALAEATTNWLADAGLIASRRAVLESRVVDLPLGYPVPTHDRTAIVGRLRAWLEARDIHTLGRFGAWEYVNSDACVMRGLQLAATLSGVRSGAEE